MSRARCWCATAVEREGDSLASTPSRHALTLTVATDNWYEKKVFGFLLFFGPLSVATSLRSALDQSQALWRRISSAGGSLLLAWVGIVLTFILLSAEVDVFCGASRMGIWDPCHGHCKCYAAAQCRCDEGYGPEVSFDSEALCACAGADQEGGCGEFGKCRDRQEQTCECDAGYSGTLCGRGTGCDGEPCGEHGSLCSPSGGNP